MASNALLHAIIMIRAANLSSHTLLLILIIFPCSFCPRFCTAQGNNTTRNACETYGSNCGTFGSCNSEDSPICSCLKGFVPENRVEWNAGNWTSGCVRRVLLNCDQNSNSATSNGRIKDGFLKLQMIKIPGYANRWFGPESECEGRCLRNCSCIAFAHDVGIGCMFWSGTLVDIQKFPSDSGSDLFIRLAKSELDHERDFKKIIMVPVISGLIIMSICICFSWKRVAEQKDKERKHKLKQGGTSDSVDSSLKNALSKFNLEELPLYKFEILENATDNFSDANKLGTGGFGPVYMGKLPKGREIAVKRLSKASGQGIEEFMNEVILISKLQHRNLVRILGCCVENKETMLIYEYMPNKSLDFFLFDPSHEILDWRKRLNIIKGICRGLLYLHRDSRLKIIHRDLKPSNILLDNDWNAKISDFGMARIFGKNKDHVSTRRVVGTFGYMAPEYAVKGRFSEKSDVFSFGVMILEISSGRRNTSFYNHESSWNLLGHVWKLWNENNIRVLIDPRISNPRNHAEVVRWIHIGLLCVQELPKDRPSISAVLSMLTSEIVKLPMPKQSAFTAKCSRSDTGTSSSQQSRCSVNDVTLTQVDGR